MTEKTLNILIQFFAYLSSTQTDNSAILVKSHIEVFLSNLFSNETVMEQLDVFDLELTKFKNQPDNSLKRGEYNNIILNTFLDELNFNLTLKQKFQVVLSLIDFSNLFKESPLYCSFIKCINTAVSVFKIDQNEFLSCKLFIEDKLCESKVALPIVIITSDDIQTSSGIRYFVKSDLNGHIKILKINSIGSFLFMASGDDQLEINGRYIFKHHVYFFQKGLSIRGPDISPIYYSDIERFFSEIALSDKVEFSVCNLEYKFDDGVTGIHTVSIDTYSGQMVAIMGGSGTGKSTFLNLLNSNLIPTQGNVFINGIDIHKNKSQMRGLIGYVPQDDVLFEELTVFQNLYYNAKLCFGNLDNNVIEEKITYSLRSLDLEEIRNLKVGTSLNKFISGGQRKRLNIALELIREPSVLFIDEPTSGLSSSDSLKVIELLKEQTLKGKLVFVNVHQPSSDIFKLFDKLLLLDKGGYSVYWGNPVESLQYLKNSLQLLDADHNECRVCGNVNPEEILFLVDYKTLDQYGRHSEIRRNSPEKWYDIFLEAYNSSENKIISLIKSIPKVSFQLPSKLSQFRIFFFRNIQAKFTDKQYVIISLIEAPLLAVILGFFMRQTDSVTHDYSFSKNENIPSYVFMSIIVALFIGLIVSSEEIIKDRKILKRESFLGLSRTAFINSKIVYLFLLSFFQMLVFVLLGNFILEIKGITFSYCLVLWSVACFANILGLNISNGFQSVIAIYITIPFLLIPQILLAGVVVNFDKLHHTLASQKYVPFFGDLMVSRWGYEAIAVDMYKRNAYQTLMKNYDQKISDNVYQTSILIPKLIDITDNIRMLIKNKENNQILIEENLLILKNEMNQYSEFFAQMKFNCIDSLYPDFVNDRVLVKVYNYFDKIKNVYLNKWEKQDRLKEIYTNELASTVGRPFLIKLKKENFNEKLNDLVLDNNEFTKCLQSKDNIIRKFQPIHFYPENKFGRAHFYAPVKRVGNYYISSIFFNVTVIWVMSILLYLMLISDIIKKINKITYKLKHSFKKFV